jgi:hypothetical protein
LKPERLLALAAVVAVMVIGAAEDPDASQPFDRPVGIRTPAERPPVATASRHSPPMAVGPSAEAPPAGAHYGCDVALPLPGDDRTVRNATNDGGEAVGRSISVDPATQAETHRTAIFWGGNSGFRAAPWRRPGG